MTPTAELAIEQQVRDLATKALTVVETAESLVIYSVEDRGRAAEIGRIIAGLDKEAEEKFSLIKTPLTQAHKAACKWEHEVRDPFERAKRYLSSQIGAFDQGQEKLRRIEEARLQEDARQHAQAEADRISQEQAIADAVELEAAGDHKGAEAVLAHPAPVAVYVPPVVIPRAVPKAEGVSSSQVWKFRITNVDLIPREYMVPDEKAIGQIARALKNKTNIPGVEVYPDNGARFRA